MSVEKNRELSAVGTGIFADFPYQESAIFRKIKKMADANVSAILPYFSITLVCPPKVRVVPSKEAEPTPMESRICVKLQSLKLLRS